MSCFYVPREGGRASWVVFVHPETGVVYSYVPDLQRFVLNGSLHADFYVDQEMTWNEVSFAEWSNLVRGGGFGLVSESHAPWLLETFALESVWITEFEAVVLAKKHGALR